jgi:hypothetical protein
MKKLFVILSLLTFSQFASAKSRFTDPVMLPENYELTSIVETIGLGRLPRFDFSVKADKSSITFRWAAVCFPQCDSGTRIPELKSFGLGLRLVEIAG